MPEYLYPGVYVEEIDTGNKPIEGVSTSTAGFLGIAERGPIVPTLLTSFGDYQRAFGSYVKDPDGTDHYLAYAIEGFFQNGGKRCFVQRVVHVDSQTPANSAAIASNTAGGMKITAVGPGNWGNNVAYQISSAGLADPSLFKLTLLYWAGGPPADLLSNPTATEIFDNLSSTPGASTFYESEINTVSNFVLVKQTAGGRPPNAPVAQVGSVATASANALTDTGTLTITSGPNNVTFTVHAAAGPIKTVGDLINAIKADAVVGAKAWLNAQGYLVLQGPAGVPDIAVSGTLAVPGAANLGAFSPIKAFNNAGTPVLLTGGNEGQNLNLLIGATAGLAPATALTDTGTLKLASGAANVTLTVNAAAGPIKTVADLMAAINADAVVGAKASLDAGGHLNLNDPQTRGNLSATGTLVAGGAGNLGAFASPQNVRLSPGDFEGTDVDPANKTGLKALADVDEISLLCCPDEFYLGAKDATIAGFLRDQCELLKDRFAILQAPISAGTPENNNPSVNSKYAAYYFPWLTVTNANTGVPVLVPAGGHIAGIYARSDNNVGVQKDPANELINGITQLQLQTNDQQQSILNPKGVNCLRYFKGSGNLVWGGRTTTTDPDWKYINVRRIFIFVEKSIQRGTQWVVFEINAEPTWARVRRSISAFLTSLWRDGVLQGAKKEQAFFVKCDNSTMSQFDIDNGRLICVIGVAPVKPAEFVIFRIGQWYGGSEITEQ